MLSAQVATFIKGLQEASSRVEKTYFQPQFAPLDPSTVPSRIWRERVYCYELYHQLRLSLSHVDKGLLASHVIFGEMDKRRYPDLTFAPKPDFIYHRPGRNGRWNNVAVVEVKTIRGIGDHEAFKRSLNTLCRTQQELKYQGSIIYIFGDDKAHSIITHG